MSITYSYQALEARVRGVNAANAAVNELQPKLAEILRPYVGQKVIKADGDVFAKIQNILDSLVPLPRSPKLTVYRHHSDYTLNWVAKTCESSPSANGFHHGHYFEQSIYVGELQDGVLTKITEHEPLKTDYKADDIVAAREAYEKAKAAADEAHGKLWPFGEHDR